MRLVLVSTASIEIGPIPFNLFAKDQQGQMVLFCKTGFPITPKHKVILQSRQGIFFVSSDELDTYHDYTFDRIDKIVSNADIPLDEKVEVVRDVGKRIVGKLLKDPRSGKAVEHSSRFVNTSIDLMLQSPRVTDKLMVVSSASAYYLSHSINVCTFSLLIAKKLFGTQRQNLLHLGLAALLHDLGMTRIPKEIIDKPGELTHVEMNIVQRHSEFTVDFLRGQKLPDSVLDACFGHHERIDGSGYPKNLKGEEIHPFARIISVADVYDALTSDRPFRRKVSHLEALTEIAREKDKYDQEALKALLEIVLNNEELLRRFLRKYGIE